MLITLLAAAALADAWDIKAPTEPKTKMTWSLNVAAKMSDAEREATMNFSQVLGERDGEKGQHSTFSWSDIEVDGNAAGENNEWKGMTNARGAILSIEDNDDLRRMLSPLVFIYPEKPVDTGDKWTVEVSPSAAGAKKLTYTFEVKGVDKVKDVDALKVASTLTEPEGMKADGTWWIGKDGKALKFEVRVKEWLVPMAGTGAFEATIKGDLKKAG